MYAAKNTFSTRTRTYSVHVFRFSSPLRKANPRNQTHRTGASRQILSVQINHVNLWSPAIVFFFTGKNVLLHYVVQKQVLQRRCSQLTRRDGKNPILASGSLPYTTVNEYIGMYSLLQYFCAINCLLAWERWVCVSQSRLSTNYYPHHGPLAMGAIPFHSTRIFYVV